jgi:hypothetical protein
VAQPKDEIPFKQQIEPAPAPKQLKEAPIVATVAPSPSPSKDGAQALMPLTLVKNRVDTLKIGEAAYVLPTAIKVDSERRCWLQTGFITGAKSAERVVQVKRDATGFHVVLESSYQWEAEDLNGAVSGWLPVKSFSAK